jgi:hypothetical protein
MITCTFEDGGTGKLRHVTVTLFIFNKQKTKVLLAQRSGKYSEPFKWGPPGGYLSRDETTYDAALRMTQHFGRPVRKQDTRQKLPLCYGLTMILTGRKKTDKMLIFSMSEKRKNKQMNMTTK